MSQEGTTIHVESLVRSQDGTPCVRFSWGEEGGDLTPQQAREHALAVLECAEAAEMDAMVFKWLIDDVGTDQQNAAKLLLDLRQLRGEMSGGKP